MCTFSLSSRGVEINFLSVSGSFYSPDINLLYNTASSVLNSLQICITFVIFNSSQNVQNVSFNQRLASVLLYWSQITAPVPMYTITIWSSIIVSFKITKVTNILKPKTLFRLWCTRVTCVAGGTHQTTTYWPPKYNALNAKLNPVYHLLALLAAHHILHFSRLRIKHSYRRRTNRRQVSVARTGKLASQRSLLEVVFHTGAS
jgi:hypothetical protein